ncbi:MAG: DUF222 domain-containing protein [Microbacterium sp.]|uniref:HNH endonuclease n=1 Tax=Microbacterium sp. TaxID=51671 RepID=UPI002628FCB4|nr:HNH endonuclease signature motif containing protein [Microbacterium sp.]MCX6501584.1 DUF222 domain-containing protein [Microbacterium sp.]
MRDDGHIAFSDQDFAELVQIAHEIEVAQTQIAAGQAAQTRALARAFALAQKQAAGQSATVRARDMALRAIAAEAAGIMRTSDRSVQRQIGDAVELVESYPATLAAWERNEITRGHVNVITQTGSILPHGDRTAFETAALEVCKRETPGRAKGPLGLMAERLHPRTIADRHHDARQQRRVTVVEGRDGMSDLIATLPTVLAVAAYDRLTAQSRAIIDARRSPEADEIVASDNRTTDEIRADILADMLLTSVPDADPTAGDDGPGALGAIRARVQVVVPALSLLGTDDGPAELVGHGPIDPDTARRLAGCTSHPLERILTHPVTGAVLHVDTYQRTAAIDRYLRARDQHCRFPGCRMPAVRCEVDHTIDYALGGKTCARNLCHLCQRHHSMKQFTAWRVRQLAGGVYEWTSPLGKVYIDEPPIPITFIPDDEPAPF